VTAFGSANPGSTVDLLEFLDGRFPHHEIEDEDAFADAEIARPGRRLRAAPPISQQLTNGATNMSTFSDRIRDQRNKGFYKVADFESGKEVTHIIASLDEEVEMFGRTMDILNFQDPPRQMQLNQTNAEILLDAFGDEPSAWAGKGVTLFLAPYEFKKETKLGIRLRPADAGAAAASAKRAVARRAEIDTEMNDSIPF
jgi:hypothetical protein